MRSVWPRVGVALLLAGTSCGPLFKGDGQLVPAAQERSQVVDSPAAEEGEGPLRETQAGPVATAATGTARGAPRAGPATRAGPAAGQAAVKRGGVVKVGGLFPLSGGLSALGTPSFQAADAYFRFLNQRGGVDGTRIQFIPCDDQADDTRSTTCAKQLADQQGIFMMGPSFTPFSLTVIGQLQRQGLPWVGFDGINIEGFQADNVVTVGAPIEQMAHALLPYWYRKLEKELGRPPRSIGAVVLDVAPAQTYMREANQVICPRLGCQVTRNQRVNYETTQYATICRNFQQARVDTVWIITDPASAVKLFSQCREIGYTPPAGYLGQHGIYIDLTLQQAGPFADGTYANSAILPDTIDAPATSEMKQIVTTYYRNATFGYFAALGYASARLVEDVLREAFRGGGELTRSGVLQAAGHITSYDCHGLCKSVSLAAPAARTGGNHNVWIVRASKGKWIYDSGPIDAWQSETWPRPGKP